MENKVWDVLHREWMYILKDPKTMVILFLVPIMYTLLFGYSYSGNQLKEVQTVVIDHDNSKLITKSFKHLTKVKHFMSSIICKVKRN